MVQIIAWRRSGDKSWSEQMMVRLPTHICVTRPQWVNWLLIEDFARSYGKTSYVILNRPHGLNTLYYNASGSIFVVWVSAKNDFFICVRRCGNDFTRDFGKIIAESPHSRQKTLFTLTHTVFYLSMGTASTLNGPWGNILWTITLLRYLSWDVLNQTEISISLIQCHRSVWQQRPVQNGRYLVNDFFKCIFVVIWNHRILIKISRQQNDHLGTSDERLISSIY